MLRHVGMHCIQNNVQQFCMATTQLSCASSSHRVRLLLSVLDCTPDSWHHVAPRPKGNHTHHVVAQVGTSWSMTLWHSRMPKGAPLSPSAFMRGVVSRKLLWPAGAAGLQTPV